MSYSLYSDFRASIEPSTARRRRKHFQSRLDAVTIAGEHAEVAGKGAPVYGEPLYEYGKLLQAHIDFADAQIKKLDKDASGKAEGLAVSAALQEHVISIDLHALPDGVHAQALLDGAPVGDRLFVSTLRRPSWRDVFRRRGC